MKERFMKNGVFSLEYDKETLKDMVLELREEIEILKKNAKNNDKVVDNVNWENQLLKKENQELKEQNKKEFADYIKFKKEQHDEYLEKVNKLIKEKQELKKQLEERPKEYVFIGNAQNKTRDFINQIVKENEGLKKQLENNLKINVADHKYASTCEDKVIVLEIQQKEFIKYLEDEIEKATTNPYTKLSEYGMNRIHIYKEILQKYKEIIGDDTNGMGNNSKR